jgi:hypothetical protein
VCVLHRPHQTRDGVDHRLQQRRQLSDGVRLEVEARNGDIVERTPPRLSDGISNGCVSASTATTKLPLSDGALRRAQSPLRAGLARSGDRFRRDARRIDPPTERRARGRILLRDDPPARRRSRPTGSAPFPLVRAKVRTTWVQTLLSTSAVTRCLRRVEPLIVVIDRHVVHVFSRSFIFGNARRCELEGEPSLNLWRRITGCSEHAHSDDGALIPGRTDGYSFGKVRLKIA